MKAGIVCLALLVTACARPMTKEQAMAVTKACMEVGMIAVIRRDNLQHPYYATSVQCYPQQEGWDG